MFDILPVLLKDGYKVGHRFQYPADTTMIYSNLTPRASRVSGCDGVIFFGLQYFIKEYLIRQFEENFFKRPLHEVMAIYKRRINNYLGPDAITFDHIEALHGLGYLPLEINAIPEGSFVPCRVPVLTMKNTQPNFFWLTNMLETLMSNILWQPSTSATTAFLYRKEFERYADLTGAPKDFCKWQGHDFSFRGLSGVEAACASGAAHLLSFTGTDTIPAIDFLERYYHADCEKELVGGSVPATEHSVMCMGGEATEEETIRRLLTIYPKGILSVVCDTWDFWNVVTNVLPNLKAEIMARDGKLVIRPDSGDPVKIICGDPSASTAWERAGAVETLASIFGVTKTPKRYFTMDPHIGLIYGDSITPLRQRQILGGLLAKGYASDNVVLGIGSYTYQMVTRDTYGFAFKATYGKTLSKGGAPISKTPKTDDGTKNSARGLLRVDYDNKTRRLALQENVQKYQTYNGALKCVFFNGKLSTGDQRLRHIRERVEHELAAQLQEESTAEVDGVVV